MTSAVLRAFNPATPIILSLGSGAWTGGFAYNNHFYLVDDGRRVTILEVWDSSGVRQSGMDISLGTGIWNGGFAYNNHFYLVDRTHLTLRGLG